MTTYSVAHSSLGPESLSLQGRKLAREAPPQVVALGALTPQPPARHESDLTGAAASVIGKRPCQCVRARFVSAVGASLAGLRFFQRCIGHQL